jgi:hypothetical protein
MAEEEDDEEELWLDPDFLAMLADLYESRLF